MHAPRAPLASATKGDAALLTLAFSTKIAASPRRVWHVLMSPSASARWLPSHEHWIDAPSERFVLQRSLRFRSRLRQIPMAGELRLLDVRPSHARMLLRIGLLCCEARFTLAPEPGDDAATRLGLLVTLANQIAVVSGSLDRFEVRKLACELAEHTLAALASCAEAPEPEPR